MLRTPQEARDHAVDVMGEPLGELYAALWQEVAGIHQVWAEYVALFGTRESRVDLLNEAAPRFARVIQDSLWERVVLHIARLTDPPQSMNKSNLTLRALPALVTAPEIRDPLDALLSRAINQAEFARDWRNRHLAHRDLALALDRPGESLKLGSRNAVKAILTTFTEILDVISHRYLASKTFFDFDDDSGGAASLLYVVDDGLRTQKERRARLRSGTARPEDHRPREV